MNILKKNSTECATLKQLIANCPNYKCLKNPSMSLNIKNLYQLTAQCFDELNKKIEIKNQVGGTDVVGPGPQPSGDLYDGIPITNVKDLYLNVRKYMKLHNIINLTEKTLIPYGIILSTLNLPNNMIILSQLYPDLTKYLAKNKLSGKLNFETLIPSGIFLNNIDLNNINHLKLN